MCTNKIKITIATHSGSFHADEVTAYTMLRIIYPDCELIRTRDPNIYNKADYIIDLGGKYNPRNGQFDHHQKGFKETLFYDIPLSSAGMIYKEFGKEFIKCLFPNVENIYDLYKSFYKKFVLEIDAIDNGISMNTKKRSRYRIYTNISAIISMMNSDDVHDDEKQMECFMRASEYVLMTMKIVLGTRIRECETFTREYKVFDNAPKIYGSQIVILPFKLTNLLKCVNKFEKKNKCKKLIKFVVYKYSKDVWRLKTISTNFNNRVDIKQIPLTENIDFVHPKGFVAGGFTLDAMVKLAEVSMNQSKL